MLRNAKTFVLSAAALLASALAGTAWADAAKPTIGVVVKIGFVEVRVIRGAIEVPPELQEEFDAWERAGAGTLEMVERLAEEMEADEKR